MVKCWTVERKGLSSKPGYVKHFSECFKHPTLIFTYIIIKRHKFCLDHGAAVFSFQNELARRDELSPGNS